jgi:serine/threonine-protein kinase HipA
MKSIQKLIVTAGGEKVGEIVAGAQGQIGFQYSGEWIDKGYSLSPMQIPFDSFVHVAQTKLFNGLYGVFADSLPDGWGLLLMDRFFRRNGVNISEVGPLDRLAYIGTRAMGALEYHPEIKREHLSFLDLGTLAKSAEKFIQGDTDDVLDELMITGGSPGGARPKVTIAFSDDFKQCISGFEAIPDGYSHWLVKFHSQEDGEYAGSTEKIYAEMAGFAGLSFPETKLLEVGGKRYFAVRRFDRAGNIKKHVLTMAGFIHADFRSPSLDYEAILGATGWLTKDIREVELAYRMSIFNVLAGNKDDHAKNFSFIMNDRWMLSPSYDLTFSNRLREHTTSMMGAGLPTKKDMDMLAAKFSINNANAIQQEVRHAVALWESLSKDFVPRNIVSDFKKKFSEIDLRVFGK